MTHCQVRLAGGDLLPNAFGWSSCGFWKLRHTQPNPFGQSHFCSKKSASNVMWFLETTSQFQGKTNMQWLLSLWFWALVVDWYFFHCFCDVVSRNRVAIWHTKFCSQCWLISYGSEIKLNSSRNIAYWGTSTATLGPWWKVVKISIGVGCLSSWKYLGILCVDCCGVAARVYICDC